MPMELKFDQIHNFENWIWHHGGSMFDSSMFLSGKTAGCAWNQWALHILIEEATMLLHPSLCLWIWQGHTKLGEIWEPGSLAGT